MEDADQGPFKLMKNRVEELGWRWEQHPLVWTRNAKCDIRIAEQEEGWWSHELR